MNHIIKLRTNEYSALIVYVLQVTVSSAREFVWLRAITDFDHGFSSIGISS